MGNCCVTPWGADDGGKRPKQPKQKKGKKSNPFSIVYNRSALPDPRLMVLREPTGWDISVRYELGGAASSGSPTSAPTAPRGRHSPASPSPRRWRLPTPVNIGDVCQEVENMCHLPKHPNIVTLRDTYADDNAVHLVMELCEGGELFDQILARGHYIERAAALVTKTIVEVVQVWPLQEACT